MFLRHDIYNIGQKRGVFSRQHDSDDIGQTRRGVLKISGRRVGVFLRHGNNGIGQNKGRVLYRADEEGCSQDNTRIIISGRRVGVF